MEVTLYCGTMEEEAGGQNLQAKEPHEDTGMEQEGDSERQSEDIVDVKGEPTTRKRETKMTSKGKEFQLTLKTDQFWRQAISLRKVITAAREEMKRDDPVIITLQEFKTDISARAQELHSLATMIHQMDWNADVESSLLEMQEVINAVITEIVSAIARVTASFKAKCLSKSGKSHRESSKKTSSRRSSLTRGSESSMGSKGSSDTRLAAILKATSLSVRMKAREREIQREEELEETKKTEQRLRALKDTEKKALELQMKAEELKLRERAQAEELKLKERAQAEELKLKERAQRLLAAKKVEELEEESRLAKLKREKQRALEHHQLATSLAEQQAIIAAISSFDKDPQTDTLPSLPLVDLIEERFRPIPLSSADPTLPPFNPNSDNLLPLNPVTLASMPSPNEVMQRVPAASTEMAALLDSMASMVSADAGDTHRGTTTPVSFGAPRHQPELKMDSLSQASVMTASPRPHLTAAPSLTGHASHDPFGGDAGNTQQTYIGRMSGATDLARSAFHDAAAETTTTDIYVDARPLISPQTLISFCDVGPLPGGGIPSAPIYTRPSLPRQEPLKTDTTTIGGPRMIGPEVAGMQPGVCMNTRSVACCTDRHTTTLGNRAHGALFSGNDFEAAVTLPQSLLRPSAEPFAPTYCVGTNASTSADTSESPMPFRAYSGPKQPTNSAPCKVTPSALSVSESMTQALVDALTLSRLPVQEPVVFMGDPLSYPTWKSSFSFLIEHKNIPSSEKLLYLQKYIGGTAKEAVSGFFLMRDQDAYEQAMQQLERRFGNAYAVSQAFRTRLEEWPTVKSRDCVALRSFADFLQQCVVASDEVGNLGILDDAHYMKRLVQKLPDWMSLRWSRRVATTKKDVGRYPTFKEFTRFVGEEADVSNDPVFGIMATSASSASKFPTPSSGNNPVKVRSNFVSGRGENPIHCLFCNKPKHDITECQTFISKSMEERREFVMKKGLCFGCLKSSDHRSRQCPDRATCNVCKKRHPTSLHYKRTPPADAETKNSDETPQTESKHQSVDSLTAADETFPKETESKRVFKAKTDKKCALTTMIVPVLVSHANYPYHEVMTYALLDTQSDATFVVNSLIEELKPPSRPATLELSTMTDHKKRVQCLKVDGLQVRGLSSQEYVQLPAAFSREAFDVDPSQLPTRDTVMKYPHLRHLADVVPPLYPGCQAGLLIGYNCSDALMPLEVVKGHPYAQRTLLGWSVVGGDVLNTAFDSLGASHHVVTKDHTESEEGVAYVYRAQVKEASASDVLRVLERDFVELEDKNLSQDDLRFIEIVRETVKINELGHYEMPLPFRDRSVKLPDNKDAALKRAAGLKRQFVRKPDYFSDYKKFMSEIIERGDAERIPAEEIDADARWYIPHHGVYHPQKPGKIRVVFDCSARYQGTCLNDHLLQGPDLLNSLMGVLCRFRKGRIAFSCDIEKMFHQFHVYPPHKDFLRFLWWENGDLCKTPVDYRMKVHIFGAVSSPGCANFGLRQMAKDNAELCQEAAAFLQQDFYVDDGLKSEDTVQKAVEVLTGAREICQRGGLRLHKIISNSCEVLERFPDSETSSITSAAVPSTQETPTIGRTLGLQWRTDTDTLGYRNDIEPGPSTRRGILSTVASLYDPLGFLSPFVLRGKLILQEMCRDNLEWDDPLPERMISRWASWLLDLTGLSRVQIARCYVPPSFGEVVKVELHHFSDASTIGYGQCSYLRLTDANGNVQCSLTAAKGRVTPLRPMTIPRLELQAAVLSVKTAKFLERELNYGSMEHYFWSDSQIVLAYIANDATRFHVFVANRIQQIREFTAVSQWRYVPSKENPADHASRGLDLDGIVESNWLHGPSFLWQSSVLPEEIVCDIPEDDVEVRSCRATSAKEHPYSSFESKVQRFSSKDALVRGIAVLVRWRESRGKKIVSKLESLKIAENYVIGRIQKEHFSRPSHPLKNTLKQLNVFTDDQGVQRVGGRSQRSCSDEGCKHPVVLPRDSHFAKLVALHCHEKIAHQGRMFTIHEIRANGFWIIGMRGVVASLIRRCTTCIRYRGNPQEQMMADLPEERVQPSPPFSYCGVDCFGPFLVKDGRREMKRYGLIVTCLASRAVHLETLDDLSTNSFINALRNVIAIRGNIRLIRCDQGTNFVGASKELRAAWKEMNSDLIAAKMLEKDCEFKFNPPSSSHRGGVWERQIRTVRSVLNGMLKRTQRLTTSALRTFLYEVMAIVNSRPLSVECLESADGPLPLTPNRILTMKSASILPPPGAFEDADMYVQKRWRSVQRLADEFWQLWRREYLATLQARRVWQKRRDNVAVGDIVLLRDDQAFRSEWKMARVVDAFQSDDGLVRSAKLKMASSSRDSSGKPTSSSVFLFRPVQKMILLVKHED